MQCGLFFHAWCLGGKLQEGRVEAIEIFRGDIGIAGVGVLSHGVGDQPPELGPHRFHLLL